jgi:hypothetical protein
VDFCKFLPCISRISCLRGYQPLCEMRNPIDTRDNYRRDLGYCSFYVPLAAYLTYTQIQALQRWARQYQARQKSNVVPKKSRRVKVAHDFASNP